MDEREADEIPRGFIKEGRMYTDCGGLAERRADAHAPRRGGVAAECLAVHKIAPASDALPEHQTETCCVQHIRHANFFDPAEHEYRDCTADDAAVNRQTAVPDRNDLRRIARIVLPAENDIVQSRAHDADRQGKKQHITQIIRPDAAARCLSGRIQIAQNKAKCNDNAVPVDRLARNAERNAV